MAERGHRPGVTPPAGTALPRERRFSLLVLSRSRRARKEQDASWTVTLSREEGLSQKQSFIPSFKSSFLEYSSIMSSQKALEGVFLETRALGPLRMTSGCTLTPAPGWSGREGVCPRVGLAQPRTPRGLV